jgi:hypothetical protein
MIAGQETKSFNKLCKEFIQNTLSITSLRVPPFPRHSDLSGQAQTLVP